MSIDPLPLAAAGHRGLGLVTHNPRDHRRFAPSPEIKPHWGDWPEWAYSAEFQAGWAASARDLAERPYTEEELADIAERIAWLYR